MFCHWHCNNLVLLFKIRSISSRPLHKVFKSNLNVSPIVLEATITSSHWSFRSFLRRISASPSLESFRCSWLLRGLLKWRWKLGWALSFFTSRSLIYLLLGPRIPFRICWWSARRRRLSCRSAVLWWLHEPENINSNQLYWLWKRFDNSLSTCQPHQRPASSTFAARPLFHNWGLQGKCRRQFEVHSPCPFPSRDSAPFW